MSEGFLPQRINLPQLADLGRQMAGRVKAEALPRLAQLAYEGRIGDAFATLDFGVDIQGWRYVRGKVTCPVSLQCQRCLGALENVIASTFALSPARTDVNEKAFPKHYDMIELDGLQVSLTAIIEDELLLSLPMVPMHAENVCPAANGKDTLLEEQQL